MGLRIGGRPLKERRDSRIQGKVWQIEVWQMSEENRRTPQANAHIIKQIKCP